MWVGINIAMSLFLWFLFSHGFEREPAFGHRLHWGLATIMAFFSAMLIGLMYFADKDRAKRVQARQDEMKAREGETVLMTCNDDAGEVNGVAKYVTNHSSGRNHKVLLQFPNHRLNVWLTPDQLSDLAAAARLLDERAPVAQETKP